jgi:hypothetical protein
MMFDCVTIGIAKAIQVGRHVNSFDCNNAVHKVFLSSELVMAKLLPLPERWLLLDYHSSDCDVSMNC